MRCEDTLELMSQSIDGRLDESDEKLLSEHLASCPACAEEFEALKASVALLQAEEPVQAPGDLAARVREELDSQPVRMPSWSIFSHPQLAVAMAAGLVLMVGIYAVVRYPEEAGLKSEMDVMPYAQPVASPELPEGENKGDVPGSGGEDEAYAREEAPPASDPLPDAASASPRPAAITLDLDEESEEGLKEARLRRSLRSTLSDDKVGDKKETATRQDVLDVVEPLRSKNEVAVLLEVEAPEVEKPATPKAKGGAIWQEQRPKGQIGPQLQVGGEDERARGMAMAPAVPVVGVDSRATLSQEKGEARELRSEETTLREATFSRESKTRSAAAEVLATRPTGRRDMPLAEVAPAPAPAEVAGDVAKQDIDDKLVAAAGLSKDRDGQDAFRRSGRRQQVHAEDIHDALTVAEPDDVEALEADVRDAKLGKMKRSISLVGAASVRGEVMRILAGREEENESFAKRVGGAFTARKRSVAARPAPIQPVSGPVASKRMDGDRHIGDDILVDVMADQVATLIKALRAVGVIATTDPGWADNALPADGIVQLRIFLAVEEE